MHLADQKVAKVITLKAAEPCSARRAVPLLASF